MSWEGDPTIGMGAVAVEVFTLPRRAPKVDRIELVLRLVEAVEGPTLSSLILLISGPLLAPLASLPPAPNPEYLLNGSTSTMDDRSESGSLILAPPHVAPAPEAGLPMLRSSKRRSRTDSSSSSS